MANVIQVQPSQKTALGTILPVAGGVVGGVIGGYYGGPAGALGGAGTGAALGGVAANMIQPSAKTAAQNSGGATESTAIARRQAQLAADNGDTTNYQKLVAAENAAGQLPEQMRQEYLASLTQARMLEQQRLMKALEQQNQQNSTGVA